MAAATASGSASLRKGSARLGCFDVSMQGLQMTSGQNPFSSFIVVVVVGCPAGGPTSSAGRHRLLLEGHARPAPEAGSRRLSRMALNLLGTSHRRRERDG